MELNACTNEFSITLDENEKERLKYEPVNPEEETKKKVRVFTWTTVVCWLAVVASMISSCVDILNLQLAFFLFIATVIVTVIYSKTKRITQERIVKLEEEKKKNILNDKHKEIYPILCDALVKNKLHECSYKDVYGE